VATLITTSDVLTVIAGQEWLVNVPARIGMPVNSIFYADAHSGNLSAFKHDCSEKNNRAFYVDDNHRKYWETVLEPARARTNKPVELSVEPRKLQNPNSRGYHPLTGDVDNFTKSIWEKVCNRSPHGEVYDKESALLLYKSAHRLVEWENSACRVQKTHDPIDGRPIFMGDCEVCFKHIQCPGCVFIMSLLGHIDLTEKCNEIQMKRPRTSTMTDFGSYSPKEQAMGYFYHTSSKSSLKACVEIQGVATKISSQTYWAFRQSRDGSVGTTEEMKREVADACFMLYRELQEKQP
jgi:hypothetical protein